MGSKKNTKQDISGYTKTKLDQLEKIKSDIERTRKDGGDITFLVMSKNVLKNEINGRL